MRKYHSGDFFPLMFLVVVALAGSLVMFWLVARWENTSQRHEFESRANMYTNAVEITLDKYVESLLFLGEFFR